MDRYEKLNEQRMLTERKKLVAAYCRVSTDREDQVNSFESQRRYFKQYIERMPDWELYEIFADEGITGTNTKKRKSFNRMISSAYRGDFDLIVTKEISRFARNTLDSIYYTRELKKRGVGVIFVNDNINTLDPDSELRLTIMSSIAQEESRRTSQRVKWGQKRQMEQGIVFGRSMLGYDVRGGQMYINEEGAKTVRIIFDKFVNEAKGTHVIARELIESGVKPMKVQKWHNAVILRILRNEKYCGDLVQKKTFTPDYLSHDKKYNRGEEEFVIIKDHHEPIISREVFERAGKILEKRAAPEKSKTKHSNRYCFSGKIKCGVCGSSYVARNKTRKDGTQYKSWRCMEGSKHGSPHINETGNQVGCSSESIRNEDAVRIMSLVCRSINIEQSGIIKKTIKTIQSIVTDTDSTDIEVFKEKIKEAEERKNRLIELYINKDIDHDEFTAVREKCVNEIAELTGVIERIEGGGAANSQNELSTGISRAVHEIISGMEYEDEFYRSLLDRMVVYSRNHIDVYLKFLPYKWSYSAAAEKVKR